MEMRNSEYTPTKQNILKVFFYCYVHKSTYQNTTFMHYFFRLKQFFSCFCCSILDAPFSEQVKYCFFQSSCNVLTVFEQTKYRKWNTAFLADLFGTCAHKSL